MQKPKACDPAKQRTATEAHTRTAPKRNPKPTRSRSHTTSTPLPSTNATKPPTGQTPAQPWGLRPFSTLCLSSPEWVGYRRVVDKSEVIHRCVRGGQDRHKTPYVRFAMGWGGLTRS